MFLILICRRYTGAQPAYRARHFACALDVFELLTAAFQHCQITTDGVAMTLESDGVFFPRVKMALCGLTSPDNKQGE